MSRMKQLDAAKKQVQHLEKQIKQAAEFASELAQRSSSADIIGNRNNLQERVEELSKTQMPALPASSFVRFEPCCPSATLSLGFIMYHDKTDAKSAAIEGMKQTFQAGVEATISICPKTREGQISNLQHKDHVEVQVELSDQLSSFFHHQRKRRQKLPGEICS